MINYEQTAVDTASSFPFHDLSATPSTFQRSTVPIWALSSVSTSTVTRRTDGEDDEEEQEWDALFAQPHVQSALCRLADEAERQFIAGETEEGGFAVE